MIPQASGGYFHPPSLIRPFPRCQADVLCTGQWSPKPLDAEHVAGQEVIPEEEDMRLLELQRAQVKYRAARQYAHAARQAAGHTDGAVFQDRAYQVRSPITLISFVA